MFLLFVGCGVCLPSHTAACCIHHNAMFITPHTHCSLLTITMFTIEH
nr:MAG TPA: hypothetical protein [Caudoviricetes sp.]